LVEKPKEKRPLARLEDNIKVVLKAKLSVCVSSIDLAQNRFQCPCFMNTVMNFGVP
jgi:hypothetical protein